MFALTLAAAMALVVGWHTRAANVVGAAVTVSVLFAVLFAADRTDLRADRFGDRWSRWVDGVRDGTRDGGDAVLQRARDLVRR